MKVFEHSLLRLIERLNRSGLMFGLGSAATVSILGVLIAGAVAHYHSSELTPGPQPFLRGAPPRKADIHRQLPENIKRQAKKGGAGNERTALAAPGKR